jgi:hypothetical protein
MERTNGAGQPSEFPALKNSQMVMEYVRLDQEPSPRSDEGAAFVVF